MLPAPDAKGPSGASPPPGLWNASPWKALWSYVVGPKQPAGPAKGAEQAADAGLDDVEAGHPAHVPPPEQQHPDPPVALASPQPLRPDPHKEGFYSSWISAMQLALWDNIFGPQVVKLWAAVEELDSDLQLHLARQVLSGEIGRIDAKVPKPETTLHVLPEVDFIVLSTLFASTYKGQQNTKFTLSVMIRKKHLSQFLRLHTIIEDRMYHLVAKYRAALEREPANALQMLETQSILFSFHLEGLYYATLPPIPFTSTHLYHGSFTIDFVARAVTALLQTGSAVVFGDKAEDVNMFINTLSLFLTPNERRRSSYVVPGRDYFPDLILQGVVRKISEEAVLQSVLPTALIDLHSLQIKKMHPYNEYIMFRREYRELEVDKLFKTRSAARLPEFGQQSLFTAVKRASPYILNLLQEVMRVDKLLRERLLRYDMQRLQRKAVLLVRYVEAELRFKGSVEGDSKSLDSSAIERMRADLDLTVDEDYFLLLNMAEKISPGIYCKVERNPELLPDLLLELFESF